MGDREYTRDVVQECCVDQQWRNRTLDNLHLLFGNGAPVDRETFWGDTSFYNLVQRPMDYARVERPEFSDFDAGWKVFLEIVKTLRPSHCVFIGVEASNSFRCCMEQAGAKFQGADWTEQVSRTWGRSANLEIQGAITYLHFIQHCGKYFSWEGWHDYLTRNCADLMGILNDPRYLQSTAAS
jgi:hypothetical protein